MRKLILSLFTALSCFAGTDPHAQLPTPSAFIQLKKAIYQVQIAPSETQGIWLRAWKEAFNHKKKLEETLHSTSINENTIAALFEHNAQVELLEIAYPILFVGKTIDEPLFQRRVNELFLVVPHSVAEVLRALEKQEMTTPLIAYEAMEKDSNLVRLEIPANQQLRYAMESFSLAADAKLPLAILQKQAALDSLERLAELESALYPSERETYSRELSPLLKKAYDQARRTHESDSTLKLEQELTQKFLIKQLGERPAASLSHLQETTRAFFQKLLDEFRDQINLQKVKKLGPSASELAHTFLEFEANQRSTAITLAPVTEDLQTLARSSFGSLLIPFILNGVLKSSELNENQRTRLDDHLLSFVNGIDFLKDIPKSEIESLQQSTKNPILRAAKLRFEKAARLIHLATLDQELETKIEELSHAPAPSPPHLIPKKIDRPAAFFALAKTRAHQSPVESDVLQSIGTWNEDARKSFGLFLERLRSLSAPSQSSFSNETHSAFEELSRSERFKSAPLLFQLSTLKHFATHTNEANLILHTLSEVAAIAIRLKLKTLGDIATLAFRAQLEKRDSQWSTVLHTANMVEAAYNRYSSLSVEIALRDPHVLTEYFKIQQSLNRGDEWWLGISEPQSLEKVSTLLPGAVKNLYWKSAKDLFSLSTRPLGNELDTALPDLDRNIESYLQHFPSKDLSATALASLLTPFIQSSWNATSGELEHLLSAPPESLGKALLQSRAAQKFYTITSQIGGIAELNQTYDQVFQWERRWSWLKQRMAGPRIFSHYAFLGSMVFYPFLHPVEHTLIAVTMLLSSAPDLTAEMGIAFEKFEEYRQIKTLMGTHTASTTLHENVDASQRREELMALGQHLLERAPFDLWFYSSLSYSFAHHFIFQYRLWNTQRTMSRYRDPEFREQYEREFRALSQAFQYLGDVNLLRNREQFRDSYRHAQRKAKRSVQDGTLTQEQADEQLARWKNADELFKQFLKKHRLPYEVFAEESKLYSHEELAELFKKFLQKKSQPPKGLLNK